MKKIRQMALIAATATALVCSTAAPASQMTYDWVGLDDGDGWSGTGTIEITDSDVVAGTNLVPFFDYWEFSWTDGTSSFDVDSSLAGLSSWSGGAAIDSSFFVDAAGAVTSAQVCIGSCATSSDLIVFATSTTWAADVGSATLMGGGPSSFTLRPSSQPRIATAPLPGTLALLGMGLLAAGIGRRKR